MKLSSGLIFAHKAHNEEYRAAAAEVEVETSGTNGKASFNLEDWRKFKGHHHHISDECLTTPSYLRG
jgi:hypothetical protein